MRGTRRKVTVELPTAVFQRIDREAAARRITKQALLSRFLTEYVMSIPAFKPADDEDEDDDEGATGHG